VVLAERDQVLTQGVANLNRLIFGGPFPSGLGSRLLCDRRKLIKRVLIVVQPDGQVAECQCVAVRTLRCQSPVTALI
jgi:hypothetical protein